MAALILGIESSCDDTSVAICRDGKILSNRVADQKVHQEYGGVVPELASRAHQENIVPVMNAALADAGLALSDMDAFAFTRGPGLIGPLLVGASFAKGLSLALAKPLIAVHHMKAHVLAHFIDDPIPEFPFLCLTVSGGHTQLVVVRDFLEMEVVGQTLDDAAGEAFDKSAKLLGLPYPGGPLIDKLGREGDPLRFSFPEPDVGPLEFSFSGLKTSVLRFVQKKRASDEAFVGQHMSDICASIQHSIVSILMRKLAQASEKLGIRQLGIAGGVSANSYLRKQLILKGEEAGWEVFVPDFQYCTDNAAMVAFTGEKQFAAADFADASVEPLARWPF